ncbi:MULTISPECIES: NAD-dependent epimerase/dehydratase family protein [unclassified Synechococcus]|uniref:NAD-dependent epimerase/dehydratase family protein n=1 Tax=unclassified Synechococcus TaxID=2626047 RepID=UPI0020CDEF69|nr:MULTISPECIES: NAD-dependent epimerase/dehydratase family protein [unclassified Synechococcus]
MLLAGHTGFKGSWLALWLTELGSIVTGIGLEPEAAPHQLQLAECIDHHIADIRHLPELQEMTLASDPEVMLHLAAQGRLKVRHKAAGAAMLVSVLLGLLSSLGPAF